MNKKHKTDDTKTGLLSQDVHKFKQINLYEKIHANMWVLLIILYTTLIVTPKPKQKLKQINKWVLLLNVWDLPFFFSIRCL